MDPKKPYVIRYTLSKDQIQDFVNGLHDMQAGMLEELVKRAQAQGFPQVKELLKLF